MTAVNVSPAAGALRQLTSLDTQFLAMETIPNHSPNEPPNAARIQYSSRIRRIR